MSLDDRPPTEGAIRVRSRVQWLEQQVLRPPVQAMSVPWWLSWALALAGVLGELRALAPGQPWVGAAGLHLRALGAHVLYRPR
jgi:hypothetical protein